MARGLALERVPAEPMGEAEAVLDVGGLKKRLESLK